jgi:hypothetical protein
MEDMTPPDTNKNTLMQIKQLEAWPCKGRINGGRE